MTTFHPVEVCRYCYYAHHYGYKAVFADGGFVVGPDFDDEKDYTEHEPLRLLAGLELFDNTDSNTGDGITEFSRASCDGCGSHLHGHRFRLASRDTTGPDLQGGTE